MRIQHVLVALLKVVQVASPSDVQVPRRLAQQIHGQKT